MDTAVEFFERKMNDLTQQVDRSFEEEAELLAKIEASRKIRGETISDLLAARKFYREAAGTEPPALPPYLLATSDPNNAVEGGTVRHRVAAYAKKAGEEGFSPKELQIALDTEGPKVSASNIWLSLTRLKDAGVIRQVGKGRYRVVLSDPEDSFSSQGENGGESDD